MFLSSSACNGDVNTTAYKKNKTVVHRSFAGTPVLWLWKIKCPVQQSTWDEVNEFSSSLCGSCKGH